MKKVLVVFGTRPEAIKLAPVIKEFRRYPEIFDLKICVSAQHRQMLDQVLEVFEIKPDYDLDLMKPRQDLYDVTASILDKLKVVLEDFNPDIVLVHGDTTTTFAASLAAFYKKIPVGHIEAGLRTNALYSPWPEEANRQLTGVLATYHFAPTKRAKENLLKENKKEQNIIVTGNSVIDALFLILQKIKSDKNIQRQIVQNLQTHISSPNFSLDGSRFILVTGHRRENFGQGFVEICEALKTIAQNNPDIPILYPVHLNPNVQEPVQSLLSKEKNIHLIKPLGYEEFVYVMSKAYCILTDSGGVQEEAPALGKPVLVMRDTTERPEAVEAGTVRLVGTDRKKIVQEVQRLLENTKEYEKMSKANNPYGDGRASQRIVEFLKGKL